MSNMKQDTVTGTLCVAIERSYAQRFGFQMPGRME